MHIIYIHGSIFVGNMQQHAEELNDLQSITEHCKQENHIMDWIKARVIPTKDNKHQLDQGGH